MAIGSIVKIYALRFPVKVETESGDGVVHVILTKEQLRAAQIIGESSKEVICRICARNGLKVLDVGKAERKEITVNLMERWD